MQEHHFFFYCYEKNKQKYILKRYMFRQNFTIGYFVFNNMYIEFCKCKTLALTNIFKKLNI